MNKRKAMVFDMDGTMYDTEPISCRCWQEVAAKYGYTVEKSLFVKMLGRDNLRIRALCMDAFGPDFPYEEICAQKVKVQLHYYQTHDIPIKPGLKETLAYAKENGISCAVASSSPRQLIQYLLEKTKVADYFAVVQSGEEAKHGKPAPDIFLMACEKLGVRPEDALVLEDSETGVLAAHAAHIPVIWIPDLVTIPEDVQKLAYARCRQMTEVPALLRKEA